MASANEDNEGAKQRLGTGEYNYVNWESLDDPLVETTEDGTRSQGTEWWTTSLIIAAIILGLGVLGLPYAFATMGWLLGILTILAAAAGAAYAGITVHQVIGSMHVTPQGYSDIGFAAYGKHGYTAVRVVQYGFLVGCITAVQLTASKSLVTVVEEAEGSLCLVTAQVLVVLTMLPVMQVQSLGQAGTYAMLPGIISIIVPLVIILAQLGHNGTQSDRPTAGFPEHSSFKLFAHGFTTIAFAFQGQQILPELRAEMRTPSEFDKSVFGSVVVMLLVYICVAVPGYYYMGNGSVYLMDALKGHAASNGTANAFLIIHVLMGYIINGNVMNKAVHAAIWSDKPTRTTWLGSTCITLLCSFLLANVVPSLSEIIGLVGATFGYGLTFVFPPLFWLALVKEQGQARYLHIGVLVLSAIVIAIGTYAEIDKLANALKNKPPFHC